MEHQDSATTPVSSNLKTAAETATVQNETSDKPGPSTTNNMKNAIVLAPEKQGYIKTPSRLKATPGEFSEDIFLDSPGEQFSIVRNIRSVENWLPNLLDQTRKLVETENKRNMTQKPDILKKPVAKNISVQKNNTANTQGKKVAPLLKNTRPRNVPVKNIPVVNVAKAGKNISKIQVAKNASVQKNTPNPPGKKVARLLKNIPFGNVPVKNIPVKNVANVTNPQPATPAAKAAAAPAKPAVPPAKAAAPTAKPAVPPAKPAAPHAKPAAQPAGKTTSYWDNISNSAMHQQSKPAAPPGSVRAPPAGLPRTFWNNISTSIIPQQFPSEAKSTNIPTHTTDVQKIAQPQSITRGEVAQQPYYASGPANVNTPIYVATNISSQYENQQYSPSDVYNASNQDEIEDLGDSADHEVTIGQKRVSAFERLGPLTQPKKPKLTINLTLNKEQDIRQVIDREGKKQYVPVHLREDVLNSKDDIVTSYLPIWPWKTTLPMKANTSIKQSKSIIFVEREQKDDGYNKDLYFVVTIRDYPESWTKEQLLDAVLQKRTKGKNLIPCFIEFNKQECKFLVLHSRAYLLSLDDMDMKPDDLDLTFTMYHPMLSIHHKDFMPRHVLKKRLISQYDGERKLSLKEFTLQPDVSHFIYFPLNRLSNQLELVELNSTIAWNYLTDLDLSHNRLTSIDGFNLTVNTPKLSNLDLSHNHFDRITFLLSVRDLPMKRLKLEGNPLCYNYTDPQHYVKVAKMIYPGLVELDSITLQIPGETPKFKKNFCPHGAKPIVDKFLETFFPLLDSPSKNRAQLADIYHEDATLSVTHRQKLNSSSVYRYCRVLFVEKPSVAGRSGIVALLCKWPPFRHDPYTFTVDVLYHTESTTVIAIGGILKLTSQSLAEDEHLLAFTRTVVLDTEDGYEYRILNEMIYWDEPVEAVGYTAFQRNTIPLTNEKLSIKLESPPDDYLKSKLTEIFMELTELDKTHSERCLKLKEWNFKIALEYFINLLKLDNLEALSVNN